MALERERGESLARFGQAELVALTQGDVSGHTCPIDLVGASGQLIEMRRGVGRGGALEARPIRCRQVMQSPGSYNPCRSGLYAGYIIRPVNS